MARPTGYTRTQIALHWAVMGLVVLQYLLHDGIAEAYDLAEDTGVFALTPLAVIHFAGGALILLLACWRLILRGERGTPAPPDGEPPLFRKLGHATHLAFYALLILLPVSGALAWGGRIEAAGEAHEVMRAVLLVLILAHVGAIVVHQLVWKTGLITRMTRPEA